MLKTEADQPDDRLDESITPIVTSIVRPAIAPLQGQALQDEQFYYREGPLGALTPEVRLFI